MNTVPVIESKKLTKSYDSLKALSNFDLTVHSGESIALLGANGAGKTTFLNILLGILPADAPPEGGEAFVFGCDCTALKRSIKEHIGLISDDAKPAPWASANDLARFYASIYPTWDFDWYYKRVEEWKIDSTRRLQSLSKGQHRLAEIALATGIRPKILVLDEPFNGLDAVNRFAVHRIFRQMQLESSTTILYTTHVLEEVEKLADRVVILRNGVKVIDSATSMLPDSIEQTFKNHYQIG